MLVWKLFKRSLLWLVSSLFVIIIYLIIVGRMDAGNLNIENWACLTSPYENHPIKTLQHKKGYLKKKQIKRIKKEKQQHIRARSLRGDAPSSHWPMRHRWPRGHGLSCISPRQMDKSCKHFKMVPVKWPTRNGFHSVAEWSEGHKTEWGEKWR